MFDLRESGFVSNLMKACANFQKKLNSGKAAASEDVPKKAPSPLEWKDLPQRCPCVPCSDSLPKDPVPKILALFERARELKKAIAKAPKTKGLHFLYAEICQAISLEKRRTAISTLGRQRRWPTVIDPDDIYY